MFYRADEPIPLPHDPFKAIVAPRPIGWIGTFDAQGRANLAPYSFFSAISTRPHMVAFTAEGLKHSARNASETGAFTCNLVTEALAEAMRISSQEWPDGVDEFEKAGLERRTAELVQAPYVAASPAVLECLTLSCKALIDREDRTTNRYMVLGQVIGTRIDDALLKHGLFDTASAGPVSRLGYRGYGTTTELWDFGVDA